MQNRNTQFKNVQVRNVVGTLVLCLLAACSTDREINLEFPSNIAAALVDTTEIYVLESTDSGECAEYLDEAFRLDGNDSVLVSSGPVDICLYQNEPPLTDSVPRGGHAYLVKAFDSANRLLFAGCRIFDPYSQEDETFVIELVPSRDFSTNYPVCESDGTCTVATKECVSGFCLPAGEELCATLDDKCNNLCR